MILGSSLRVLGIKTPADTAGTVAGPGETANPRPGQGKGSLWCLCLTGILALSLGLLCGCAGLRSGPTPGKKEVAAFLSTSGDPWLRTELYFGMNKPGGEVSEEEWRSFVTEMVTPRFPEGLTILRGDGQWRDASGRIQREESRVLILLHPPTRAVAEHLEEVRKIYCARFGQASVLRVTLPARVSFDTATSHAGR